MSGKLRLDIWSDVVCPWCYIGKRRLESALERFEHAAEVELHWHSFQLDPAHPKGHREPSNDMLAKKIGASPAHSERMPMSAQVGLSPHPTGGLAHQHLRTALMAVESLLEAEAPHGDGERTV